MEEAVFFFFYEWKEESSGYKFPRLEGSMRAR
jgi:hypothetical protein